MTPALNDQEHLLMSIWSRVVFLFLIFGLTGCGQSGKLDRPVSSGASLVGLGKGQVAPEIVGIDADGQRFKLSDYRGKVVVLDFWATW
jgi:cytochrome oxidase Cu insertion factor (SCO1/SenC/PrrC family)